VGEINLFSFYLPIKNKAKVKLQDEITYVLHWYDYEEKLNYLTTAFAKVKTDKEVKEFEKTYNCISDKIVFDLVREFHLKKSRNENV